MKGSKTRTRDGLYIGRTLEESRTVFLSDEQRSTHLHVLGSTGTGKSKVLEWMIRQDIIEGRGMCLIDPHGYLYQDLILWLATKRLDRKIILFNPEEDNWVVSFNPFKRSSADLSHQVDSMVKAVAKVFGADSLDQTPLLKRILRNIFFVLAEKNLTLLEAQYLINPLEKEIRQQLTANLSDPLVQSQWEYFNTLSPQKYYEEFGSSINRLTEFLGAQRIRRIIGQQENTLDFRKMMDEGYIFLVNLSSGKKMSRENARLLGTLIVNDLFLAAPGRPPKSRPFYLYIDEFAQFVNEDISRILDEGRKFGLHLILAHQHLNQLKKDDSNVYHSVMTNAKTKLIFGGLDYEDAETVAQQIFLGEFDLNEIKNKLEQTKFKPVESTRTIKGSGHASAQGGGSSQGSVSSHGQAHVISEGLFTPSPQQHTDSTGSSYNSGSSDSWSDTDSYSESEVPWYEYEEFKETSSVQFRSIEEQLYRAMSLMVNQPSQQAILKALTNRTVLVRIPTVEEGYANPGRVEKYKQKLYSLADVIKTSEKAQEEIDIRTKEIETTALFIEEKPIIKYDYKTSTPEKVRKKK